MDGKLNCSLSAENAAFTKIRHLENQVKETIEQVDRLGDQVLENENALDDHITQVSEQLDTNKVIADTVDAETVEAVDVVADNVNVLNITATDISAETLSARQIENVSSISAVEVNTSELISDVSTTTEATITNAEITNADVANLDVENVNIEGSTNIAGDVTFTKDNGLSKLSGEYLDIEASNITIENKNGDTRTALLVKDVDSLVEFEGKLKVHNDTELERLTVNKEAYLEDAYLDNPTFENIKQTQEVSSTCIDLDEDGKFIRVKIGESSEVVSTALKSVVEGVEKVNISAEGAVFDVPVTITDTATIDSISADNVTVSDSINTKDITATNAQFVDLRSTIINADFVGTTDATITNATIEEKATITEIESSIISTEKVTTEEATIDSMIFYNGEWYDTIIRNEPEFIDYFTSDKSITKDNYKVLVTNSLVFDPENVPTAVNAPQDGTHNIYFVEYCTISFRNSATSSTVNALYNMNTIFSKSLLHNGELYCKASHAQYLSLVHMTGGNIYVDDSTTSTDNTSFSAMLSLAGLTDVNVQFYNKRNTNFSNWLIILSECKNTYVTSSVGAMSNYVSSISFQGSTENCTVKASNLQITTSTVFSISTNNFSNTVIDDNSSSSICFGEIITSNYMSFVNGKQYDKIVYSKNELYNYMKQPAFSDKRYNVLFIGPYQVNFGDSTDVNGANGTFKKQVNLYSSTYTTFRINSSDIDDVPSTIFDNIEFYNCKFQIPNAMFVKDGVSLSVVSLFKLKGCSVSVTSMLPEPDEFYIGFKDCKDLRVEFYADDGNSTTVLQNCENVFLSIPSSVTSNVPRFSNCDRCSVVVNNNISSFELYPQYGPGANMVYDNVNDTVLTPQYYGLV